MKALPFALALFALTATLPAQAQNPLERLQAPRPLRLAAPGSNATFEGIGTNLPIASITFSARNTISSFSGSSGGAAGKVALSEVTVVRKSDDVSPDFFLYCATGKRIPSVVLKSGGFTITLNDALISGQQFSTDENGAFVETITVVFPRIRITSPGNKTKGWDVSRNATFNG